MDRSPSTPIRQSQASSRPSSRSRSRRSTPRRPVTPHYINALANLTPSRVRPKPFINNKDTLRLLSRTIISEKVASKEPSEIENTKFEGTQKLQPPINFVNDHLSVNDFSDNLFKLNSDLNGQIDEANRIFELQNNQIILTPPIHFTHHTDVRTPILNNDLIDFNKSNESLLTYNNPVPVPNPSTPDTKTTNNKHLESSTNTQTPSNQIKSDFFDGIAKPEGIMPSSIQNSSLQNSKTSSIQNSPIHEKAVRHLYNINEEFVIRDYDRNDTNERTSYNGRESKEKEVLQSDMHESDINSQLDFQARDIQDLKYVGDDGIKIKDIQKMGQRDNQSAQDFGEDQAVVDQQYEMDMMSMNDGLNDGINDNEVFGAEIINDIVDNQADFEYIAITDHKPGDDGIMSAENERIETGTENQNENEEDEVGIDNNVEGEQSEQEIENENADNIFRAEGDSDNLEGNNLEQSNIEFSGNDQDQDMIQEGIFEEFTIDDENIQTPFPLIAGPPHSTHEPTRRINPNTIKTKGSAQQQAKIPLSHIKRIMKTHTQTNLSPDILQFLQSASLDFFDQLSSDLENYATHGKRKMLNYTDVLLYMKRTRLDEGNDDNEIWKLCHDNLSLDNFLVVEKNLKNL